MHPESAHSQTTSNVSVTTANASLRASIRSLISRNVASFWPTRVCRSSMARSYAEASIGAAREPAVGALAFAFCVRDVRSPPSGWVGRGRSGRNRLQAIFLSESCNRALSASSSPARQSTATSARSSSWAACSQTARRKISAVTSLPSGAISTPSGAGASEGARGGPARTPAEPLLRLVAVSVAMVATALGKAAADHVADRYRRHQRPRTRRVEVVRLLCGHEHSSNHSDHRPELGRQKRGLCLLASCHRRLGLLETALVRRDVACCHLQLPLLSCPVSMPRRGGE